MSKSWLDNTVKILELISIPIVLIITVYSFVRDYLTDFWKGFVLGALVIFFLMLAVNVYLYGARKTKRVEGDSVQPSHAESVLPTRTPTEKVMHIEGGENILRQARGFVTRWNQYLALGEDRWRRQYRRDMQAFAGFTSDAVLTSHSRSSGSWDAGFRNQVDLFTRELRQFALAEILVAGSRDYEEMEKHGKAAYDLATALVSYFESKRK